MTAERKVTISVWGVLENARCARTEDETSTVISRGSPGSSTPLSGYIWTASRSGSVVLRARNIKRCSFWFELKRYTMARPRAGLEAWSVCVLGWTTERMVCVGPDVGTRVGGDVMA